MLPAASLNAYLKANLEAQFPLGAPAWTTYTPTLTQSATITKTVAYAKYTQVGKLVIVNGTLSCTSAGTANNPVSVGLPITGAFASNQVVGTGYIFDVSGTTNVPGLAVMQSTTVLRFVDSTQSIGVLLGSTGSAFPGAIASGDAVVFSAMYEAA